MSHGGVKEMIEKQGKFAITESVAMALVELLKNKDLANIKVKEIVDKAGVSRMTYYRYYDSKEEILTTYAGEIINQFQQKLIQSERNYSYITHENLVLWLDYVCEHQKFIICLIENGMESFIYHAILRYQLGLSLNARRHWKDRYIVISYSNTLAGIMIEWVQSDPKESSDEIAALICELFQDKIRRY